jgi:hypothetical protein
MYLIRGCRRGWIVELARKTACAGGTFGLALLVFVLIGTFLSIGSRPSKACSCTDPCNPNCPNYNWCHPSCHNCDDDDPCTTDICNGPNSCTYYEIPDCTCTAGLTGTAQITRTDDCTCNNNCGGVTYIWWPTYECSGQCPPNTGSCMIKSSGTHICGFEFPCETPDGGTPCNCLIGPATNTMKCPGTCTCATPI